MLFLPANQLVVHPISLQPNLPYLLVFNPLPVHQTTPLLNLLLNPLKNLLRIRVFNPHPRRLLFLPFNLQESLHYNLPRSQALSPQLNPQLNRHTILPIHLPPSQLRNQAHLQLADPLTHQLDIQVLFQAVSPARIHLSNPLFIPLLNLQVYHLHNLQVILVCNHPFLQQSNHQLCLLLSHLATLQSNHLPVLPCNPPAPLQ